MPPALCKVLQFETKDDHKLALVVDMQISLLSEIQAVLDGGKPRWFGLKIPLLVPADKELVARYKETRRSHPLAADGQF